MAPLQKLLKAIANWYAQAIGSNVAEAQKPPPQLKASYRGYELDFTPTYHLNRSEPFWATAKVLKQEGLRWSYTECHGALYATQNEAADAGHQLGRLCVDEQIAREADAAYKTAQASNAR